MKSHVKTRPQARPSEPPATQSLFQRLEALEKEMDGATAHTGNARWMIPYADLLTLLLGFFVVLFASTQAPKPELKPPPAPTQAQTEKTQAAKDSETTEDKALASQLKAKLGAGMNMQGIEIRQQERGLVISLKDSILFAPGNADLSPGAIKTLDKLANQLSAALGGVTRPIRVEGHTDNTPIRTSQFPSNWELSTARATNIVRYLVASHHFPPAMLSAGGYGEFKPVADNSSIEGKQKNRRVDIVVLNTVTAQQEPPAPSKH